MLIPLEQRTWSRFRGYEKVRVRRGDSSVAGAVRSSTVYRYHRGMHGDHLPGGGTRTATVTDSRGVHPVLRRISLVGVQQRAVVDADGVHGGVFDAF
jgi:hypothetical protein